MKPFVFSLERMRNYKEQLLNREKEQLAKLQKQKNDVSNKIDDLKEYRVREGARLRSEANKGFSAFEISAYNFFMNNTKHQITDLQKDLKDLELKVEEQLKVVVEASKDRNGLDKLEEKQLEEYKTMEAKDNENRIAEQVTLSMIKRKVENVGS